MEMGIKGHCILSWSYEALLGPIQASQVHIFKMVDSSDIHLEAHLKSIFVCFFVSSLGLCKQVIMFVVFTLTFIRRKKKSSSKSYKEQKHCTNSNQKESHPKSLVILM